jgi:exonuclease SbcC
MKPVKIFMQAFGPYLNKTEIDFTKFYDYGLFLITGATGCGKTTILDAMSYALYGCASGSVRDVRDMRSISAPDDLETRVIFEMELGANRYKFDRAIKIRKVKKRSGEVERTAQYEESCYVFSGGDWKLLCTGSKVKDKAVELLGFSHEQFSQVVVLPQGEFRRLLTAPSREKQEILETLFGTARWQAFTKVLSERSKSIEADLAQCEERRVTLCKSAECENKEAIESLLEKLKNDLEQSKILSKKYSEAFDRVRAASTDAQTLDNRFSELDTERENLKKLMLQADENDKKRHKLETAQKALEIVPYLEALESAQKALDTAAKEADSAQMALEAAQKEQTQAQKELCGCADGDARLKELAAKIARAESVLAQSRELGALTKELDAKKKQHDKALSLLDGERKNIDKITAELEKTKLCIKENRDNFVSHLPDLISKKEELSTAAQVYKNLAAQQKSVSMLEKDLQAKRQEYKIIAQSLKNENQVLENMLKMADSDAAYRLAQELRDGCSCPVCGSHEHPEPAKPVHGAPSKEEIETQKQAVNTLSEREKQARGEGELIRGKYEEAVKRLNEILTESEKYKSTPEQTNSNLAAVTAALGKAREAQKTVNSAEEKEKQLETQLSEAKKNLDDLKSQSDKIAVELSSIEGKAAQLLKLVPENLRDSGEVEKRLKSLANQYDRLDAQIKAARERGEKTNSALAAAKQRVHSAEKAKSDAQEKFSAADKEYQRRMSESNLPADESLRSLLLTQQEREKLSAEIAEFDRTLNLVKDKTAALENELREVERPDIESLKQAEAKAREEMEQALLQKGAIEAKISSLLGINEKLALTLKQEEKLRGDFALYNHIFRLSNGDNPLKTPIHQFVLGLMLDDIVTSANIHLSELSHSRYTLIRSVSPSRGGGTKGLELSVEDAWSGGERAVSTLSGGEMFLASLSLAFGLSDVVQSYAGGIFLDSLFIDEGFGSLDVETLETAMRALERLRSSGILIGVISHVRELRERIPAHIDVMRLSDGTSAAKEITP